jgi:hypothetical protein
MGLLRLLGLHTDTQLQTAGGVTVNLGGSGTPTPPVDKNKQAYDTSRAAVKLLVDGIAAHPQKDEIATQITAARAKLKDADDQAAAKAWPAATKLLLETRTLCQTAKKLADDWQAYKRERTSLLAAGMSFSSSTDKNNENWAQEQIDKAAVFTAKTPPNFASAMQELKKAMTTLKPIVKDLLVSAQARLKTLEKSKPALKTFAKVEIDKGTELIATAQAAFDAGEWSACRTSALHALRFVAPAIRMVEGRGVFDDERAKTVAAIKKVRDAAAVQDRAAALDLLLADADKLGAYDTRKFDAGAQQLKSIADQAAVWSGLARTVDAYRRDETTATSDLDALDKHPGAARLTTERAAIRTQLGAAKTEATQAATAADPAAAWGVAVTTLARVRADLAAAKKTAESLGVAAAAENAAKNPADTAALATALQKLAADGKVAAKAAGADQAADAFKRFDQQVALASQALQANDGAKAAPALAAAAAALAEAKAIQAGHAQVVAARPAIEAELKTLKKSPRAAGIKARIDAVETALAEAIARDQAHVATEAMAALRRANDALAQARKADADRKHFDEQAEALGKRITATKDGTERAALQKITDDAKALADSFDFAGAGKGLKALEVRLDKGKLQAMMAANGSEKELAKLANKMVENGGADTVDGMIQAVPDGSDPKQLNALATGRYGTKFKSETSTLPGADQAKAMKAICKMFSDIPQDIRKNRSIKGVTHSDADGSAGGAHNFDNAAVTMNGRPGQIDQDFGPGQTQPDPKTGTDVPQLPAVEDAAQPVNNTAVDYLGFAAAHEVGHGVDDAIGFMARQGHLEKHGGWITYGSGLQPVADAVGGDARFSAYYKTPEQKAYVLGKLQSKPVEAPPVASGSPEEAAKHAFDDWYDIATAEDVYRRQGDCDAIKIGTRIYQEAYPRTWVSYLAVARKQGLTGYQFRAPPEWFAELYAGYRSNKLKPNHPAMDWLTTLAKKT